MSTDRSLYSKFGITVAEIAVAMVPSLSVILKSDPSRVLGSAGQEVCTCTTSVL
jgi:hypothetical protein